MPQSSFTVYFEDPFWVGLYQRVENGALRVCKVTFGAQPRDQEVYQFLLENWHKLVFGPPVEAGARPLAASCKKPKRRQRAIARQQSAPGAGTRAQQAISAGRESAKRQRQAAGRRQKQAEAERRYRQHLEKKKEKHKGH